MPTSPRRRFTIADAMILVTAAAVGALALRSYLPGFLQLFGSLRTIPGDRFGLFLALACVRGPGSCLAVPLMAGLVGLRLRRPRPPWRRIRDEPGFVAGVVGLVSLVPGLAWHSAIRHRPGFHSRASFDQVWYLWTHWTPEAVAGAWLALWLAGRWRPTPDWVDRAGRALGVFWVGATGAHFVAEWVGAIDRLVARWW